MDKPLAHKIERGRAIYRRGDQPYSGARQVLSEDRRGWVATGDEEAGFRRLFAEELNKRAPGIGEKTIGGWEAQRSRRNGHADEPVADAAERDGAARKGIAAADQVGLDGARGFGQIGVECEEVFDGDFEGAGEAECDGCVRNVVAGFHGVHRLAADTRFTRQGCGGDAALLADFGQAVPDSRPTGCIMVKCGGHCLL
jgi:hypothetical protein